MRYDMYFGNNNKDSSAIWLFFDGFWDALSYKYIYFDSFCKKPVSKSKCQNDGVKYEKCWVREEERVSAHARLKT